MHFNQFVAMHFPHLNINKYVVVDLEMALGFGFATVKEFSDAYRTAMFEIYEVKRKRAAIRREREMLEEKPEHDKRARKHIMKVFNELYNTQQHGKGFPAEKVRYKGYRVFFCLTDYPTPRGKHTYVEMYNALGIVKRYKIHIKLPGNIQRAVTHMLKKRTK